MDIDGWSFSVAEVSSCLVVNNNTINTIATTVSLTPTNISISRISMNANCAIKQNVMKSKNINTKMHFILNIWCETRAKNDSHRWKKTIAFQKITPMHTLNFWTNKLTFIFSSCMFIPTAAFKRPYKQMRLIKDVSSLQLANA